MRTYYRTFLMIIFTCISLASAAQTNTFTVGLNLTHFSDWKNGQFLNFFNPEVGYSKKLKENTSISTSLNGFDGEPLRVKERKEGFVT